MFAMGLGLFALAYWQYTEIGWFVPLRWIQFIVIGAIALVIGIFFLIIRLIAYVQPFPTHLKFVTPFLRFNISYKRIHRTSTSEMRLLFPPKSMSGWMRDIFAPLASQTAVIIDLKGYPVSSTLLRLFLSRFFFKDKTPHLVILVKDWMKFITELDSMRAGGDPYPPRSSRQPRNNSILSKLPRQ